ncbi:MAG TPA: malonate decarboxylase subunit epsilon [Metabacillus sp.]|nr:malonate decarboxylase subunit epsilon [Metabacillus sp.]
MKRAFLFPGQGSQRPNLLNELPKHQMIDSTISEASEIVNENMYNLHTEEALTSTRAVQLTLLTAEVATYRLFESKGIKPDFVAGHSVGAFSAAVAAGVIDFKDALELVHLRGQVMEQLFPEGYGMAVVLGLTSGEVHSLIDATLDTEYPVYMANQNSPDQFTLSGAMPGLHRLVEKLTKHGARSACFLNVSTPSHCPLMLPVSKALREKAAHISFKNPVIPFVGNVRARVLFHSVDIRLDIVDNVSCPVQWHNASTVLYENGVRTFIEMPPGNVLSRLAEKAFHDARVVSVSEHSFEDCVYICNLKSKDEGRLES